MVLGFWIDLLPLSAGFCVYVCLGYVQSLEQAEVGIGVGVGMDTRWLLIEDSLSTCLMGNQTRRRQSRIASRELDAKMYINPRCSTKSRKYSNCLHHKIKYSHSLFLSAANNDGASFGNHPYTEKERHSTVS